MSQIKGICFFDLDGTLLNAQSQVDESVIEAINLLKKNQFLPVIATGRNIASVQHVMTSTKIETIIALNGQYIERQGTKLYEAIIPTDLLNKFVKFSHELGNEICYNNAHYIWASGHNQIMDAAYSEINMSTPKIDKELHFRENVNMILTLTDNPSQDILYKNTFPELSFFRNSMFSMDTVSNGSSKGKSVTILLDKLGMKNVPTYAFGDGMNDIELFQNVDYSVAMGNGVNELKAIANYVTSKNTDGGLIQAFKHLGLLG